MEGSGLERRHWLDRSWTGAGRHISGLRCRWEDHRARIAMKGQKKVVQGNQLNKEEHLHRMSNKEAESDFTH
eukprot:1823013-Heterocapsa_arctica.AAC.1